MLTVACVEWGNYQGRGQQYVDRLRSMVARHLSRPHRFECLRPDNGLRGWWNKIELFRPGRFCGRVLYLDLDSVIVGDLTPLAAASGILDLTQWGWDRKVYGSGVMAWEAGEHEEIFTRFTPEVAERLEGDQDWITELGGWPALPAGLCVSYRYHAVQAPPADARVVCFHGRPKPHEIEEGWVPTAWN